MDIQKQIEFWLKSAEHDLPVSESLLEKGHYSWCLFIGHLVLEKALKAIYVKDHKELPPKIHNLVTLVEATTLELNVAQRDFIDMANDFHIEARYPDEKMKFYKLCTKEFAMENFLQIKEMYEWIKSEIK